jgi:hypothetical protein
LKKLKIKPLLSFRLKEKLLLFLAMLLVNSKHFPKMKPPLQRCCFGQTFSFSSEINGSKMFDDFHARCVLVTKSKNVSRRDEAHTGRRLKCK